MRNKLPSLMLFAAVFVLLFSVESIPPSAYAASAVKANVCYIDFLFIFLIIATGALTWICSNIARLAWYGALGIVLKQRYVFVFQALLTASFYIACLMYGIKGSAFVWLSLLFCMVIEKAKIELFKK